MKKIISLIADILLVVGGVAWGVFAFGKNVVNMLLGKFPMVEMIVYIAVGVSALIFAYNRWKK